MSSKRSLEVKPRKSASKKPKKGDIVDLPRTDAELGPVDSALINFKPVEFSLDDVKLDSFILIIGKRRYGKSVYARWMLSKLWHCFPRGIYVMTMTSKKRFLFKITDYRTQQFLVRACTRFQNIPRYEIKYKQPVANKTQDSSLKSFNPYSMSRSRSMSSS